MGAACCDALLSLRHGSSRAGDGFRVKFCERAVTSAGAACAVVLTCCGWALRLQARNRRLAAEVQALQQAASAREEGLARAGEQAAALSQRLAERQALVERLERDLVSA